LVVPEHPHASEGADSGRVIGLARFGIDSLNVIEVSRCAVRLLPRRHDLSAFHLRLCAILR